MSDAPEELEDISGVGGAKAEALRAAGFETVESVRRATQDELAEAEGVGQALAARIKAEVGDVEVEASDEDAEPEAAEGEAEPPEPDAEPEPPSPDEETPEIDDISGVGPAKAEALREAGFDTIEAVQAASQEELADVEGIGMALAARINADAGGLEVAEESEAAVDEAEPDEPDSAEAVLADIESP
jgi:large subunit ribosomal protein L32e